MTEADKYVYREKTKNEKPRYRREKGPILRPEPGELAPRLNGVEREGKRPARRSREPRAQARRDALQGREVHVSQPAAAAATAAAAAAVPRGGAGGKM